MLFCRSVAERVRNTVRWETVEPAEWEKGIRVKLQHFKTVTQVTWHGRGDYFATVMPDGQNRSVLINQLSRRRSQLPFTKSKGLVQCVLFHPVRPFLFVAVSLLKLSFAILRILEVILFTDSAKCPDLRSGETRIS